jgi:hypothetical protein
MNDVSLTSIAGEVTEGKCLVQGYLSFHIMFCVST